MFTFLQVESLMSDADPTSFATGDIIPPELMSMIIGLGVGLVLIFALIYIYVSLAFMAIGKNLGADSGVTRMAGRPFPRGELAHRAGLGRCQLPPLFSHQPC